MWDPLQTHRNDFKGQGLVTIARRHTKRAASDRHHQTGTKSINVKPRRAPMVNACELPVHTSFHSLLFLARRSVLEKYRKETFACRNPPIALDGLEHVR